jgi:hypothetical protein
MFWLVVLMKLACSITAGDIKILDSTKEKQDV